MRFVRGFRFRLIPFFAMLVVVAIGTALGQWQLRRADEKRAIEVKLTQRAAAPVLHLDATTGELGSLEFRRLRLTGAFVAAWPLYLDNRPYQSRAGLYVLTPFRLAGRSDVVMVQRGWVARDPRDREHVPPLTTPAGQLSIEGTLRRAPGHVMQLGQAPELRPGAIVQNLDLGDFARTSGMALQPYLLEQTSDSGDGLVRDWPRPSSGIDRHLGYAFQWFALAALACVFFVVTGFRRGKSADT
jgi:surfeit locus 1 family protein